MEFLNNKALISERRLLILLVFVSSFFCSFSQSDTLTPEDSLKIYKKIKKVAYKNRYTRWLYHNVFVDPEPREYSEGPATKETRLVNPYILYEKKIIRKINIQVYDPFGNPITDTCCKKPTFMQKLGNNLHVKTRSWVIADRLLFKENQKLEPLKLSESERIMREAVYVNDAVIFVTKTEHPDSVDVNVMVVDRWPIIIPFMITDVSASVRFRNKNFLGLGQQLEQFVYYKRPDVVELSGFYDVTNIDNTFMASRLAYQHTIDYTNLTLFLDRPVISPIMKWSWGATLNNSWRYFDYTHSVDSTPQRADIDLFSYDVWTGRNFKLSKRNTIFNQSTNITVGLRHFRYLFLERPAFDIDTSRTNYAATAFLGNVGFSIQQYYKDRFIYRFGANEDVPHGLISQIIYGALKHEFKPLRYYLAVELARAKHFDFGYMTATFSYGVFFNRGLSNDVTTNFRLYYFSDALKGGRWLFRQFFSYNLMHGANKLANETITLTGDEMQGFQSQTLSGTTKMVFNSESVAYAPYNMLGFRVAPVFQIGLGMVGDHSSPLFSSRLFQAYTLGIMFRNENLLASTFQVSVGLYPFFPDEGNYRFIYNPVGSFTIKVRSFGIGRPDFVPYF